MIRLLIWLLLFYIGYRVILSLTSPKKKEPAGTPTGSDGTETHRDPVCGIYVTEDDAVIGRVEGRRHYFCSMDCLEKYREQLEHPSRTEPTER